MSGLRQALRRWFRHAFLDQPGRWWHFLLTTVLVLLSLPVFAALALTIRLWIGPVDVTDSARRLVASARPGLVLGRVRLAWDGWRHGPNAPVGLLIDDASLGQTRIGHAFAAFDVIALLHGRATVVAFTTDDSAVMLYRDRAGGITIQPTRPQASASARPAADRLDLTHLRRVGVTHSTVILHDAASGRSGHADIADLTLASSGGRDHAGVTGHVAATLSYGEAAPRIVLRGQGLEHSPNGTGTGSGTVWRLTMDPVTPAAFAHLDPALAPLAVFDLPVGLALVTTLSGGVSDAVLPREMELAATMGAGAIRLGAPEGSADAGVPVAAGRADLAIALPGAAGGTTRLVLSDASLQLAGADAPALHLAGTLSRTGPRIRTGLEMRVARFDFAGLPRIWPQQLAGGARRWITGNVTGGLGRDLAVAAGLESDSGLDGLHLTRLSGGLDASRLTLHWLRPIAPLQEMDAHLVLEGPDALRIEARHAVQDVPGLPGQAAPAQAGLVAGPATIRITGLSAKDQLAHIDVHLGGPLQAVIALLAHPRLKLLSLHPVSFTDPSGTAAVHLVLSIPLVDRVSADDIPVRVDAALTGVHLGDVAAHRDLDRANLSLTADNDGLRLNGQGDFGGLPSDLSYEMDFRPGRPDQTTERGHLVGRVDAAAVRREGLDDAHRFNGEASLDLGYDRKRSGAARIALALDLTRSGLDTPLWSKPPGRAAQASGVIGLQDNRLVSIDTLHAAGPDLLLDAHADIAAGHPSALVIERFGIGRSRGAGRIELPAPGTQRPIRIMLHGATLDLVPYFRRSGLDDAKTAAPATPAAPAGATAWHADLAFRRVLFGPDRAFDGVTLHAEATGLRVANARLAIEGPAALTASLSPDRGGRRLVLDARDTGVLLSTLGVGERIEGGVLRLEGRMEDRPAGMRLTALAKIGPFTVHDAPLAARLVRNLSIYGFLMGAPSRQLVISRFEIPFTVEGDTLRLTGAHASNDALGATLRGPIDLRQETLDLRGTIVPSYLFNALPGKLPGVGKVFSPEQGGGLLAVTLRVTGSVDRPAIKVNPLALLAPGILRRLLFD